MRKVIIIAAVGRNGEIGRDGKLPWHLPLDLKDFKNKTFGHTVIMGRITAESIGKRLPNRRNVVISRSGAAPYKDQIGVRSFSEAMNGATDRVFVIGGASVYRAAMPFATHWDLTMTHLDVPDADTFMPLPWLER